MCRSAACGGRRCAKTEQTKASERAAAKRYYARKKARAKIATLATDGILAVGDQDMPRTYHWGTKPDLDAFQDVKDPEHHMGKPEGVLWSAPGRVCDDGSVKSGWTDWIVREGYDFTGARTFGPTNDNPDILHVTIPQPGAVIVRVETADHLHALARRYPNAAAPIHDGHALRPYPFSWEAMLADGIDAVFVTSRGLNRARGDKTFDASFATWDVTSVVWLSSDHLTIDCAVRRGDYEVNDDPDDEWMSRKRGDDFWQFNEDSPRTRDAQNSEGAADSAAVEATRVLREWIESDPVDTTGLDADEALRQLRERLDA